MSDAVNFVIPFVDHEPDDLRSQLPVRGRLLRRIAGPPRRPEYWLGGLAVPISWTTDGVTRTIRQVILTARWEGTALGPGAKLPVNLWYVIDDAVIGRESFEASQAEFVAIGTIMVSKLPIWWLRFRAVFSTP
jgi:hypothetical protein